MMRSYGTMLRVLMSCALCLACATPGGTPRSERGRAALEAADLALARGDIEVANEAYDRVLEKSPENPQALLGGARAQLAAGNGELAVERFSAYREQGGSWRKMEQWEFCSALVLGTEQRLASQNGAASALELAQRLEGEDCKQDRTAGLLMQSGLAVANRELREGRSEKALEAYLALIARPQSPAEVIALSHGPGQSDSSGGASPRERAYLAAARLMVDAGRRDDALALLSRGLDEFPANRDLVHRMVTLLADGSSVVFPREKPPAPQQPAAKE